MYRALLISLLLLIALPGAARADTVTFTGPPIAINDGSVASPFPSSLEVARVTGVLTNVSVGLFEVAHEAPNDLDVLLVGPGGQRVVVFSDACQSEIWAAVDIVFDDSAAGPAPFGPPTSQADSCEPGFFKPTNHPPAESFPAPAPNPPYGSALAAFNGSAPLGTWRLFAVDDSSFFGGKIQAWGIALTGVKTTLKCGGRRATIVGTAQRNLIRGTNRGDVIVALGGNDKVLGRGGPDRICGGAGKDKLVGGPGKDRLFGGAGRDTLIGGKGKDRLRGGGGRDRERR